MPAQTNFSVSPYFDDYNETKDFYKILIHPGVAIQARELNQLQTILQMQIERFGDNIFQRGTIISGCHMNFQSNLPYIKINDTETDGTPVNVAQLQGLYLKNSGNLQSIVVTSVAGYQSRNPDLNTLYIKYLNSGDSQNTSTYAADDNLVVYDRANPIFKVNVVDGSAGFTTTDSVVFLSALAIQNTSGGTTFTSGFNVGDVVTNGVLANAHAVVVSINTTASNTSTILGIRPYANALAISNTSSWTFNVADSIINANTGQTANVVSIVGSGASATIANLDSVGQLFGISMITNGSGYIVNPYVSIASSSANTQQIATANLVPQTYLTQIKVANTLTSPIGSGYGMTVDDGMIYQKGYFARVEKQLVIVSKYNQQPDQVSVGFNTTETIINANIDPSLFDNASNTTNETAPGADRLKLTPTLVVLPTNVAEANNDFLAIAEFSAGQPYIQNQQTQYSIIGEALASRSYDEAGNFVLDPFYMKTLSPTSLADELTYVNAVIDPGKAYIGGYLVETKYNYTLPIPKGTATAISNTATVSLAYGNYVYITQLGGGFNFATGDQVKLYDTAKTYVSSAAGVTPSAAGTQIGVARIRSMISYSGIAGTPTAKYKLYLFDIKMNQGTNFNSVRSIFYDGTIKGVADTITELVSSSSNTVGTVLYDNKSTAMLFYTGQDALKNANNISYTYRTVANSVSANTLGKFVISLTGETFPYSGTLSSSQRTEILVVPQANTQAAANISGALTTNATNTTVTGVATAFLTELNPGDYIVASNGGTTSAALQIASIANNTSLSLTANAGTTIAGTANAYIYFPQFIPIAMDNPVRNANVSANGSVLTVGLGVQLAGAGTTAMAVTYDATASNVTVQPKTPNRNLYVRLNVANNAASNSGPWCLGISDIFRMRGVYLGANNSFAPGDTGVSDISNEFYIDHNQNDSYLGVGYLHLKPTSRYNVSNTAWLLVNLDAFTTTANGLKDVVSYLPSGIATDASPLTTTLTSINTLEIPEMYDAKGTYYDLRDQMDFRPISTATANLTSTAASATINPIEPIDSARFTTGAMKFPSPYHTTMSCTLEFFQGRRDLVVVDSKGVFTTIEGVAGTSNPPKQPSNSLAIGQLKIPPYPSLANGLSANLIQFADTRIANGRYLFDRISKYTVIQTSPDQGGVISQPMGYTMAHIGDLERRIRDLEYYVSFTLAESEVRSKTILGIAGIERYKYGFLVDSFNDYSTCDRQNPEFNAIVDNNRLKARSTSVIVKHEIIPGQQSTFPYNQTAVCRQPNATNGPLPVSGTTSNTTVAQSTQLYITYSKNDSVSNTCNVFEESEFKFSATAGLATIYFEFEDIVGGIEIYYGSNTGFSTSGLTPLYTAGNIIALSSTDKLMLKSFDPVGEWDRNGAGTPSLTTICSGKPALSYSQGKISWQHDPTKGQYIKVRVIKHSWNNETDYSGSVQGRPGNAGHPYIFSYVTSYPSDHVAVVQPATAVVTQITYNGILSYMSPTTFTVRRQEVTQTTSVGGPSLSNIQYSTPSQSFTFVFTGLRPNTKHTFVFENNDLTVDCQQLGTDTASSRPLGGGLVSDSTGALSFTFYHRITNMPVTAYQESNYMTNTSVGVKQFSVHNDDMSSIGSGTIGISDWVANATAPVANRTGLNMTATDQSRITGVTSFAPAGFSVNTIS